MSRPSCGWERAMVFDRSLTGRQKVTEEPKLKFSGDKPYFGLAVIMFRRADLMNAPNGRRDTSFNS